MEYLNYDFYLGRSHGRAIWFASLTLPSLLHDCKPLERVKASSSETEYIRNIRRLNKECEWLMYERNFRKPTHHYSEKYQWCWKNSARTDWIYVYSPEGVKYYRDGNFFCDYVPYLIEDAKRIIYELQDDYKFWETKSVREKQNEGSKSEELLNIFSNVINNCLEISSLYDNRDIIDLFIKNEIITVDADFDVSRNFMVHTSLGKIIDFMSEFKDKVIVEQKEKVEKLMNGLFENFFSIVGRSYLEVKRKLEDENRISRARIAHSKDLVLKSLENIFSSNGGGE